MSCQRSVAEAERNWFAHLATAACGEALAGSPE
jgi:hypothetical protein